MGFVYLLHFDRPISPRHTTQHYLGYTSSLARRLRKHASGNGARLLQVARERGIGWRLVRVWRGDLARERRIKNRKEGVRLCPVCNPGNRLEMADEVGSLARWAEHTG